jgi:hypothetical protein
MMGLSRSVHGKILPESFLGRGDDDGFRRSESEKWRHDSVVRFSETGNELWGPMNVFHLFSSTS